MTDKTTRLRTRRQTMLDRRGFLNAAGAATLAQLSAGPALALAATAKRYRVAVIGHTGRGNYGHGVDAVWREIPQAEVVAVADANAEGLTAAVKRTGAAKGFDDYRRMLDEVKPELVAIGPRWIDQHRDMVLAAVHCGARGIYMEKPFCRTMAEADELAAACEKSGAKLALAHQTRYSPKLAVIRDLIASGRIGRVLEFRARGKEDGRGGGEDLWVLGTHVLNLIHHLGGDPQWCFATVRQDGHPLAARDVQEGPEGIGPLAGDEVHAQYGLAGGAMAYFDSVRNAGGKSQRFGLWIFGSEGAIETHTGYLPPTYFLPDGAWSPGRSGKSWLPVASVGVAAAEPLSDGGLAAGNVLAVKDLIAAIEQDRQPLSNIYEARTATEMIVAVFESQRQGKPVNIPLRNRQNPLTMLG